MLGAVQLLLDDLERDRHGQLPVLVLVMVAQLHVALVVDLELFVTDDENFVGTTFHSDFLKGYWIAVENMA